MLSIILATHNDERTLLPTLTALVPGALAGIISEVVVADCGSSDGTLAIADAAGCTVMAASAKARGLREAAAAARAPWLMFVRPGLVPEPHWTHAVERFVGAADGGAEWRAATFRQTFGGDAGFSIARDILARLRARFVRAFDPDQGLMLTKRHYETLGGHRDEARDCEADLLRRIGRRRITLLECGATPPPHRAKG